MTGELLPALQLPAERLLLSSELELGVPIIEAVERGIRDSLMVVTVVTPSFARDPWMRFGELLARTPSTEGTVLVPILLDDGGRPPTNDAHMYLDCRDAADRPETPARLRESMRRRGAAVGGDPPASQWRSGPDEHGRYDLFIAYPSPQRARARALFHRLASNFHVFLDCESLDAGVPWQLAIPAALRASRASVFLIPAGTDVSWYLGAELTLAVELARTGQEGHVAIPVLLDRAASLPYALFGRVSIDASDDLDLERTADRVRAFLSGALRPA